MRGCLKRVVPGIFLRQGAAKILNFAIIVPLHRYSLRLSLAFQTTSKAFQSLSAEARAFQEKFSAIAYETLHPVVRVHPETQERGLFWEGLSATFVAFPPPNQPMCYACCKAISPDLKILFAGVGSQGMWPFGLIG